MIQYGQDYDESLVPAFIGGPMRGATDIGYGAYWNGDVRWSDVIYPYAKSEQVYNCPSMPTSAKFKLSPGDSTWIYYGGYSINAVHFRQYAGPPQKPPISQFISDGTFYNQKLASVEAPATTVWVTDNALGAKNSSGNLLLTAGDPSQDHLRLGWGLITIDGGMPQALTDISPPVVGRTSTDLSGAAAARHLDTINVLWVDGHVKAMKPESLVPNGSDKFFTVQDD
jgi:prepilin-type processing-associated H-X9-DG protein